MILVIDPLSILYETLTMAKLHMAEVLVCPPEAIEAQIVPDKETGNLGFRFTVSRRHVLGVTMDAVEAVIQQVHKDCVAEFELRRRENAKTRDEVLRELRGDGV